MKQKSDEKRVSDFFHSMEKSESSMEPSVELDAIILKAAADHTVKAPNRSRNKYFLSLSAAASVFVVVTIALTMSVMTSDGVEYQQQTIIKQPMYMLQRSKPASANEMTLHINTLLDKGDIEHARILFKKMKVRYPNHKIETELAERLK